MKRFAMIAGPLVGAAVLVGAVNFVTLQQPLNAAVDGDSRNEGIEARAHYAYYVQPNVVVFDLRAIDGEKSPMDVMRAFLQFADAMKGREYARIVLAHRGRPKFQIEGRYFKQLGEEYEQQNPLYTLRTLPENLYKPDGTQAFGTWSGGVLGVLKEQVEDFGEFHRQWYIQDLTARDPG